MVPRCRHTVAGISKQNVSLVIKDKYMAAKLDYSRIAIVLIYLSCVAFIAGCRKGPTQPPKQNPGSTTQAQQEKNSEADEQKAKAVTSLLHCKRFELIL